MIKIIHFPSAHSVMILSLMIMIFGCTDRVIDGANSGDNGNPEDPGPRRWIQMNGPLDGEILSMGTDIFGNVFVGTVNGSVYKSPVNSNGWISFSQGLPGDIVQSLMIDGRFNLLAGLKTSGLFQTNIDTVNWSKTHLNDTTVWSLTMNRHQQIFAGTSNGVYWSTDGGIRWEKRSSGLGNAIVISFSVSSDNKIFAGTQGNGIFTSTDNGENWEQNNFAIGKILTLAHNRFDHVFVGTAGLGAFISETNGATWTVPISGLTMDTVQSFVFNSTGEGFVAGRGSPVLESRDNGFNWKPFIDTLMTVNATALILDREEKLFVGIQNGLVFRTSSSTRSN